MNTKELTLQLSMYRKKGKNSIVFKKPGVLYRINNLLEPLWFIAEMIQLAKAIATGAAQNSRYKLGAKGGSEWILETICAEGWMRLNLWLLIGELPHSRCVFAWSGRDAEFVKRAADLGHWN